MKTTLSKTRIYIPTPLRLYTEGQNAVELGGETVGDLLKNLVDRFPDLRTHLYDERGTLRSFINIYAGDEDIRFLQQEATRLRPGEKVSIVPSIAGGNGNTGVKTCFVAKKTG